MHEGIATRIVEPSGVKTGEIYLHVIMPNYPPVATVVTPIDFDFAPIDWETVHSTTEYVLYRRR